MTAALANLSALVLLMTVTAYSVAGGVDFGAGIWDLLAGRGRRAHEARALIDHAMAPVWEANNVWLVFAIVVCWTGFPSPFPARVREPLSALQPRAAGCDPARRLLRLSAYRLRPADGASEQLGLRN